MNDIWKYVTDNRPNEVRSMLNNFGYPVNDKFDLNANFRHFFKQCDSNQKEKVMLKITEIHPDRELIEAAVLESQPKAKKVFKACGCTAKAASGAVVSPESPSSSPNALTLRQEMMKEMNMNLIKLAIGAIVVFLAIKYMK